MFFAFFSSFLIFFGFAEQMAINRVFFVVQCRILNPTSLRGDELRWAERDDVAPRLQKIGFSAYDSHQHQDTPKKEKLLTRRCFSFFGAPWRTRTVDTKRRRLVLYPSELMVHIQFQGRGIGLRSSRHFPELRSGTLPLL